MINELTNEQVAKFGEYVSKWTSIGLTTARRTVEDAERDFSIFQRIILNRNTPAPVVLVDSPRQCNLKIKEVSKIASSEKMRCIYPSFDCQFWAGWFSFYDFMEKELGIKYTNKAEYDAMKNCVGYGMVYPLENVCIVCQPPTIINKNANGLHCENGPALSYNGDNELYALNGVVMDKKYVLIAAELLNPVDVLKETNVEIRRELIRKIGIERMLEVLPNKVLDSVGDYELLSIQLSDTITDARYLKMKNPSIGVFHLEGVNPQIATVNAALEWRNNNMFTNAEILT